MVPVLSRWQVEDLMERREFVSFDLEISKYRVAYVGRYAKFNYGGVNYEISLDELPEAGDCEVYALVGDKWRELSIADKHFYKLCVFKRGWAPTLMIDGITMHSVLENPLSLAAKKVVGVQGRVFECCTGLGYTTIEALKKGARYVLTVEADPNVLTLAAYNPYSRDLWSLKVDIIVEDCVNFIHSVRNNAFSYVIHDPPRISYATQRLYSEYLYREFFRILKKGGGLFHYVSQTGTKYRGLNPAKGVVERLRKVGFVVKEVREGLGVYAKKR